MPDPEKNESKDKVPCFDIDEVTSDPKTRVQVFSDMVRPMADFAGLGWSGSEGIETARMWLLDRVILTEMKLSAHLMMRRPIHLRKYPRDTVMVRHHIEGETNNEIGIDAYRAAKGNVHITDMTELYSGVATATHFIAAVFSHETIGYDPLRHPAHVPVVPPAPYDCAIGDCLRSLRTFAVQDGLPEAEKVAGDLISLMRAHLETISQQPSEPAPSQLRRLQMRAFVEKSLSDPNLSADMIAEAFSVSRATVYRELQSFGGLQRYLLRRRLEEACKELAFGAEKRGAVAEAAERWQFASVQHFSREFKERFGISPSQTIGTSLFQLAPDDPREMGKTTMRGTPPWFVEI